MRIPCGLFSRPSQVCGGWCEGLVWWFNGLGVEFGVGDLLSFSHYIRV